MKLYTDLDILNGLSTCRDIFEAKAYLKANNIDISDQELEVLQSQYSKKNSERTLTKELLNKVAGGMFGAEAHRTRAVKPELAQYRIDPQRDERYEHFNIESFRVGRSAVNKTSSMTELVDGLSAFFRGKSGGLSLREVLNGAKFFDVEHEEFREENAKLKEANADLIARLKYYEQRYGEIPDLNEVIPSLPPDSRHHSPPNSP